MSALEDYLELVERLGSGGINRSENDLSSNLKNALTSFGLFGVIDTGGGSNRVKRPDITLYTDVYSADIAAASEVVIESKKPFELSSFPSLKDAIISDNIFSDKLVPYVRAHAERVQFFVLTTFERFLVCPISLELRSVIATNPIPDVPALKTRIVEESTEFNLATSSGRDDFVVWVEQLTPANLAPPPLSTITDIHRIRDSRSLEAFASRLADVVVGPQGRATPTGAVISTIRQQAASLDDLDPAVRRGLVIFTMAANGGMSIEAAQGYLETHLQSELQEFVSASVHSLIGRLFAIKAIEDGFCVGTNPPLIPEADWVFHSTQFDQTTSPELPEQFFSSLAGLANADNLAVRDVAATGQFYDWISTQVGSVSFRRLIELFFSHNFSELNGDLLGRFFELYAQRVDRRKRKQLGQYYTPMPIVRHMWRLAMNIVRERGVLSDLMALDPGVGSGTFLIEGASRLHGAGLPRFWERLTGFDISAQSIVIAQVNLYLAVLAHLDRQQADAVGTLPLYPTDTLDPRNGARLRGILPILIDERTRAFIQQRIALSETVKQQSHFTLIIGNPPYRNNSDQTLAQVADKFPMLLRSSRDNARAKERNIRDDYAWFFAAADHYVSERGMIAFVVSDSFCYATSYRFFREDLIRRYHIRHLVNLGVSLFRDVGPRTQFVIIVLERRENELPQADDIEPFEYCDLRPLAAEWVGELGHDDDPRLTALDQGTLPASESFLPTRERSFALFPADDVVARVNQVSTSLYSKSPDRVFVSKWPGIITAFDQLFKAKTRDELSEKIQSFFAVTQLSGNAREAALDSLATEIRANSEKSRARLAIMANQASDAGLQFDGAKLKRVVSGSVPNDESWYPNERLTSWVYYEPRLAVPRNQNEGRDPGWGTMSQWRDAATHEIAPKFIFTTSTNPASGLKAMVLSGEWMVKVHGGESQQFNYTGLHDPTIQPTLTPNNLGPKATIFLEALLARGYHEEDFLFYLAGIYNSQLAEDYLNGGGSETMRIPLDVETTDWEAVQRVINASTTLTNLNRLAVEATAPVEGELAERLASRELLVELGFEESPGSGGRFRQRPTWAASAATPTRLAQATATVRDQLDSDVNALFPPA